MLSSLVFAGVTITSRDDALADPQWSKPRIELWNPNGLATIIVQEQNGQAYAEIDLGGATLAPGESYRWVNGSSICRCRQP